MKSMFYILACIVLSMSVAQAGNTLVTTTDFIANKCNACHGYNGIGGRSAPKIAGMTKEDIILGMKKPIMTPITSTLSEKELNALAKHYSDMPGNSKPGEVVYVRDILKIMSENCSSCHSSGGVGTTKVGLNLTSYKALMKGTGNGPLVVPGKPEASSLYRAVSRQDNMRMPLGDAPLSSVELSTIYNWIKQGAKNN